MQEKYLHHHRKGKNKPKNPLRFIHLDYYKFFIYNILMIEKVWTAKMDSLPGEILDRFELNLVLPQTRPLRCFLAGLGWNKFLTKLTKYLNGSNSKVFINPPHTQPVPIIEDKIKATWGNNLFILPTQPKSSNFETALNTFPPNTFDIIVLLWSLSPTRPDRIFKQIHQALKPRGQFALVTPFDSSPRLVFSILKQTIKQVTSTRLKLYPSKLPANKRQLRKSLECTGFKEVRIWSNTIKYDYPNGRSIFSDLLKLSPGNLFYEAVTAQDKRFIQKRFIELIEKTRSPNKPPAITVDFEFGCAIGIK